MPTHAPNLRLLLLTGLGLGHLRPAPGTWGSLPPVFLALGMVWLLSESGFSNTDHLVLNVSLALFGLIFAIACVRFGAEAELAFGKKDPGRVVADEIAGQSLALLLLPWRAVHNTEDLRWNLTIAAIAFFAFRTADILKPPPARGLQRLTGGWGILTDDLFAGAYALAVTQVITRIALG